MTINITIDNDRTIAGIQQLTLDETTGLQTTVDTNGTPTSDPDDDVGATYDSGTNAFGSAALDAAFVTFISGLFPSDPARDAALGYVASVGGTSSSDTFIQVTTDAGETINGLVFSIASGNSTGLIAGMTTLAGDPLYFHIAGDNHFATLTTDAGSGGRIVAAFYLDESDDHLSGQVQLVTFEPIKETDTSNSDEALSFTDVLQISASGSTNFSFNNLPSGNFLYAAFGSSTSALLITGDNLSVQHNNTPKNGEIIKNASDTVNTSQAAPGAQATIGVNAQHFVSGGSGQNKVDGSIANFTLVSGFVPLANSTIPATGVNVQDIDYGGYINTTGAGIDISQLTGGNAHADLRVSLWEADANIATQALEVEEGFAYIDNDFASNTNPIDDDTALHDDIPIAVGQVKVTHLGVVLTFNASGTQNGVTVTFGTGTHSNEFTVTGLAGLDKVDWTAAGGDTFNRFKIQALSTTSAFDLGGVHVDTSSTSSVGLGSHLVVDDSGPSITLETSGQVTHDESAGLQTQADGNNSTTTEDDNDDDVASLPAIAELTDRLTALGLSGQIGQATSVSALVTPSGGTDGIANLSLGVKLAGASGLSAVNGGAVTLAVDSVVDNLVIGTDTDGNTVVAIYLHADGKLTVIQYEALVHPTAGNGTTPANSFDEQIDINDGVLFAVVTDGDGDKAEVDIGDRVNFEDDGPTITVPFDADTGTVGNQTPEKLGNAVNQTASGGFGYDLGADVHSAAFYTGGGSDFVDTNGSLTGVQISLTGTVDNAQNPNITQAVATRTAETSTSATFSFSFHYDADPETAGVQDATAGGTLVFNKTADTYTFTLTDAIDGFSFEVLHTAELIAKQPTGNTGHPLIVAEQLTPNGDPNPFFVQFTANSITQLIGFGFNSTGDGAPTAGDVSFDAGDRVTNVNEDWVSATQSTNGVAGDTIQKGELLTLRFFQENILGDVNPGAPDGGTERLDPTTTASGVVIKFDGIGNAEDLVLILDLKDANGIETTRAVNVQNSDFIKGNANIPSPYNLEFTLDHNDALLIIEQNDYAAAGETYQIQGIQIMQSANGLTGTAIDLDGAIGTNHGSSTTTGLTAWDPTDNDVLKIVDIGFVQQTSGTIDADLDFSFRVADADNDVTGVQHLFVNVSNEWIVV